MKNTAIQKAVHRINLRDQKSDFAYWQSQPLARASPRWKRSAGNTMVGDTVLNQDFRKFIQSLNDNGVRYLVIGGYAVAFHGHPRYTKDMAVWIAMDAENAANMVEFASLSLQAANFLTPDQIVQLGYPPNRIDVITTAAGVEFETCFTARVQSDVNGVLVNFIDLESLKRNKSAVGRHQDLADVENLKE